MEKKQSEYLFWNRIMNYELRSKGSNVKCQMSSKSVGFTLIELLIYVSLLSIFLTGAVLFIWDIIYGRVKSQVQQEVNQNLRLASKRILSEIRNASGINYLDPNDLCLAFSTTDRNPTRIYLDSNRLYLGWGGESTDCTSLSYNEPLTSNKVEVYELILEDLSLDDESSKNIRFTISIRNINPSGRQEWEKSQTYSSSAEIRSN